MIYEEVFRTSLGDGSITPDPLYFHRRVGVKLKGGELKNRTINNGLALLQSCQQAHEEGTANLYRNHVFYFDDTRYDRWSYKIDVTAQCYYCQRLQGSEPSGGWRYGDHCYDANGFDLNHEILIPYCDFIYMRDWLSIIGAKNRLLIRHVQLHFNQSQFAKVLGAGHWGGKPRKLTSVGGDFVERGLQELALGHNLETITISFEVPKTGEYSIDLAYAPLQLFPDDPHFHSDRLKKALCNISGIRTLVCEPTRVKQLEDSHGSDSDRMAGIRASIEESGMS
ncbi:hypothetical protein IMSHALPRED_010219 [Imshaugia aleurites]|uniref:Uncharacterized protein n=1 Tax=Imshaugia aleurites TaxID=172621 RepID=A0A8H3G5Z8_9LECA|nr:hypothetical protein IMSHALPRED_010219 [Imshaugia aleurites]